MNITEDLFQVVSSFVEKKDPLLQSQFIMELQNEATEPCACLLYDNEIIVKLKKNQKDRYLRIRIQFDLIFELLRDQDKKTHEKPYGIRLQKGNHSITFSGQEQDTYLLKWRDELAKRLNQKGFHDTFKAIKKIGKGNFATVYLVQKHEDEKKYAVKAFSKEAAYAQQSGKESLINEIQVMRKFNHKNLMKLVQVYESQNSLYMTVELLEGGQLYDKLKVKHKLTPKEIKLTMKGILEGLEVMHSHNIMHRDLKPENILLRKEGDFDCVIADFGLAEDALANYMFVRCGTPGYVAPEIVNLKDLKAKYTTKCDLFSVGVIFHLLVLKKSPFPGKQYDEVLTQNRECRISFQGSEYQGLPETWLHLMKLLLEKDPVKRISATEALNHDFFSKDELFKEFTMFRKSLLVSTQECNSPLMLTRNKDRKVKGLLRDDSCLKFKMKENVMTGRADQSGETIDEIDSPMPKKQRILKPNESRFKNTTK